MSEHGERLARIETKIDMVLIRDTDHEKRIRALEKRVWTFAGTVTALGVVLSIALKKLGLT